MTYSPYDGPWQVYDDPKSVNVIDPKLVPSGLVRERLLALTVDQIAAATGEFSHRATAQYIIGRRDRLLEAMACPEMFAPPSGR